MQQCKHTTEITKLGKQQGMETTDNYVLLEQPHFDTSQQYCKLGSFCVWEILWKWLFVAFNELMSSQVADWYAL